LESLFGRFLIGAIAVLTLVWTATGVLAAAGRTDEAVATHKLIVAVEKNLAPAGEKKLAVLVLIGRNGGALAGALGRPGKPLTVLQESSGLYRVRAEIDSSCKGGCSASYRISGSTDHKLEVIPNCRLEGSGFVCSRVRIVRVY
jgi:hypothetical protein